MAAQTRPISTNFFSYFTIPTLCLLGLLTFLCITQFSDLYRYYQSNVVINSAIILLIIYCVLKILRNNLLFYSCSKYLSRIDRVVKREDFSENRINRLLRQLKSSGRFIDMIYTKNAIAAMPEKKALFITDHEAKLIKNKIGTRSTFLTNNISYFSGVLVILGLLGTFWGLLITISSVASVLGNLSEIMEQDGGDSMVQLLSGISGPLTGMEVAFSSSLFGLTGSLFIGVLNNFSAGVKNHFIESTTGWIDRKIPSLDSAMASEANELVENGNDNYKTWIASYILQSNKTNEHVSQLMGMLRKLCEVTEENIGKTVNISDSQQKMENALSHLGNISAAAYDEHTQLLRNVHEGSKDLNEGLSNVAQENIARNNITEHNNQLLHTLKETVEKNAKHSEIDALLKDQHQTAQKNAKRDAKLVQDMIKKSSKEDA